MEDCDSRRSGRCPECNRRIYGVYPGEPASCGFCGWSEYLEKDLDDAARDFEDFLNSLSPEALREYEERSRS